MKHSNPQSLQILTNMHKNFKIWKILSFFVILSLQILSPQFLTKMHKIFKILCLQILSLQILTNMHKIFKNWTSQM